MNELTYDKPSPGSWTIDRAHCHRPRSPLLHGTAELFTEGFRRGFAEYGVLLDTIELAYVHGFPYLCVRPVGAPPEPKGLPPKFLFKLVARLHPKIRRRTKRAAQTFANQSWRQAFDDFHERFYPQLKERLFALQAVALPELDDDDAWAHFERAHEVVRESFLHHFETAPTHMIAIGDFMAHVVEWTGAETREIVAVLRGASPYSIDAVNLVDRAAEAVATSEQHLSVLHSDRAASEILATLRDAGGTVGESVEAWLDVVGHRIFTGYDVDALTGLEAPDALLRCLRASVARGSTAKGQDHQVAALANLRARVPAEHHTTFDAMYEEARKIYGLRDAHSAGCEAWTIGVLRRAALELGRRLVERGRIAAREHVFELRVDELRAMWRDGSGPPAEELAGRQEKRREQRAADAPDILGPPPAPSPPAEWLPGASARLQRAANTYLGAMLDEPEAKPTKDVTGLGAAPGTHVGTARLIDSPGDFERIQQGDVLVTTITTPSYNVLLPLLGAVVTDRGGLLSHPAIVAREYGIPAVVGTQCATRRISDGARVEVDGDAGTVRVVP